MSLNHSVMGTSELGATVEGVDGSNIPLLVAGEISLGVGVLEPSTCFRRDTFSVVAVRSC